MFFFAVWVSGAHKRNIRLAICLCVAAIVFTVQLAASHFHMLELLPLAGYGLALGYCIFDLRRRIVSVAAMTLAILAQRRLADTLPMN